MEKQKNNKLQYCKRLLLRVIWVVLVIGIYITIQITIFQLLYSPFWDFIFRHGFYILIGVNLIGIPVIIRYFLWDDIKKIWKRSFKILWMILLILLVWKLIWEIKIEDMYESYKHKQFLLNYTPAEDDYAEKMKNLNEDDSEILAYEQEAIQIDEYNFSQLEKVKQILKEVPIEEYDFRNIEEFNEQFNADITPIKNCYYIEATEIIPIRYKEIWDWYIFWFKLESRKYQKKHNIEYFAYPEYSLSYNRACDADLWPWWLFDVVWMTCDDRSWWNFKWRTSRPCR